MALEMLHSSDFHSQAVTVELLALNKLSIFTAPQTGDPYWHLSWQQHSLDLL